MKIRFVIIICGFLLIACSDKLSLEKELACSTSIGKTAEKADFNKKIKIEVPTHWKKSGYFDDAQSSIMAADTIKQLKETYILDVAYKYGTISIDDNFTNEVNKSNDLKVLRHNTETYKELPTYWQISAGEKNGYTYHLLNIFIEASTKGHIEIKAEFYGSDFVDERLCEALAVINTLEINE